MILKTLSPLDCPQISFLEIEIEETTENYKPYLKNYLKEIGNKKSNLFTDISNFISYELGQPTHCFDRNTIKGKLIFQNKYCNNKFKTLLDTEIFLKDQNCVFTLDDEIISLAGVMGGASTCCSSETKKVLVECAYFNPESIIGKSIKYNLVSDAAHKFERGVDIESQEFVLRRFTKIVQDHANIKSIKFKSFIENEFESILIPIDIYKINKILGTSFDETECLGYLKNLGFDISNKITVPSYRHDIKTQNDLAEEIARIIGYNNIQSTPINLKKINKDQQSKKTKMIKSFLCNNGFSEVINFPFSSEERAESITIDNPLDSNRKNFRTSIKDSLIENLLYNERRQKDSLKLFEVSNIYTKDEIIKQQKKIGIIISGRLGNNYKDFSKKLDKKYLSELLSKVFGKDMFTITEISRNNLTTKKKDKIFYTEALVNDIPDDFLFNPKKDNEIINFVSYKPVSDFPSSSRDFSFSITNLEIVNDVVKNLNDITDEIVKDSFIFDFYKNEKLNLVKLGYRFIFQSNFKTLSEEEINKKVQEIINPIIEIDGVSIPGM